MPRRALCLELRELPPRPRPLTASELSHVFGGGGCGMDNQSCDIFKPCCESQGYICHHTTHKCYNPTPEPIPQDTLQWTDIHSL